MKTFGVVQTRVTLRGEISNSNRAFVLIRLSDRRAMSNTKELVKIVQMCE